MARNQVVGGREQGIIETLSNGPIPKVEVHHTIGDGQEDGLIQKVALDPREVAPVVGDATTRGRQEGEGEKPAAPRIFAVLESKNVLDRVSGTRTRINAGKEISTQHYDVRDLQRQGLKLKEITGRDEYEPLQVG